MFKAIKSFVDNSASSHTLPFNAGDIFCIVEKTNKTWWLASNSAGKTGYVLSSHLEPFEKDDTQGIIIQSIDRAIAAVYSSSSSKDLTAEQQSMLRKLNQHKQEVISAAESKKDIGKRRAPPPPTRTPDRIAPPPPQRSLSTKRTAPPKPDSNHRPSESAPAVKDEKVVEKVEISSVNDVCSSKSGFLQESTVKVPVQLGRELVAKVQTEGQLSEMKSRQVVESLLTVIGDNIPSLVNVVKEIAETLPDVQDTGDPALERLGFALANLTEIKDDGQQNNWAIEDDEHKISEILNEIIQSLSSANKQGCIRELLYNDSESIVMLAAYHQMESRIALRLLVLQVLGIICSLSNLLISNLMSTVLPLELVQDITVHTDDIQRVCYSALVLSMVFSTGEPIPLNYYDTINEKFFSFLIGSVESGTDGDTDDRIPDIFVRLILAINLHFQVPADNLVMNAITENRCTVLSEKVMLLVNRGDDPVKITDEEPLPPNSVIKFLQDIFSRADTGLCFLYTNDLLVLTDIIARNLADLPSGSKTRTDYLDLLLSMLSTSSYKENKHRASEILSILERIKNEELPTEDAESSEVAEFDKTIVKRILEEQRECFT